MDKQKINQYLTEQVFGECWHDIKDGGFTCLKCHKFLGQRFVFGKNKDFFTNEGCMELWLKIQEMDWFFELTRHLYWYDPYAGVSCILQDIHPDHLAPAVYKFLKVGIK